MHSDPATIEVSFGVIDEDGAYIVCLTIRGETKEADWSNEMKFEETEAGWTEMMDWIDKFVNDKSRCVFVIPRGPIMLDSLCWSLTDSDYFVGRIDREELSAIQEANIESPRQHLVQALAEIGLTRSLTRSESLDANSRGLISLKKAVDQLRADIAEQMERVRALDAGKPGDKIIVRLEVDSLNDRTANLKEAIAGYRKLASELSAAEREIVESY